MPLLDDIAERDVVPVVARQADHLREVAEWLGVVGRSPSTPATCRTLTDSPPPVARVVLRRFIQEETGADHPPSADTVARSLDVVHGRIRSTELGRGWTLRRRQGVARCRVRVRAPGRVGRAMGGPLEDQPGLGDLVLTEDQIRDRVAELGQEITADYADDPPLLVCVLKGALVFMADLARAIDLTVDIDFMAVSSYGSATKTSGVVRIVKDLDVDLADRHVLIVEDIVDSGLTLAYLRKYLNARNPASLEVCALLLREGLQKSDPDLRYIGFTIPPAFVVGYGLDVAERFRNLAAICRVWNPRATSTCVTIRRSPFGPDGRWRASFASRRNSIG